MSASQVPVHFSLKGLLIAPIPVPLLASALFVTHMDGGKPLPAFVFFSFAGLIVSGLGTLSLAIGVWLVSRFRQVTAVLCAVMGLLLAAAGYLVFSWISWRASGPNSGPPDEGFLASLRHEDAAFFLGVFLLGGIVTALLYHRFCPRGVALARPPIPS